jgi:hypothetical protein
MTPSLSARLILVSVVVVVVAGLAGLVRAGIEGGGNASTEYVGAIGDAGARREFSVVLDRVLFPLLSMRGKYQVVRIVMRNGGPAVPLSMEKDTISATIGPEGGPEKVVKGIVNIGGEDPDFWGALTQEQRNTLAYPDDVPAAPGGGGGNSPPVVRAIYVFFPSADVAALPRNFTYHIDSVGQPIDIRPRRAAAN